VERSPPAGHRQAQSQFQGQERRRHQGRYRISG
jgi:hypothetical protein